MILSDAMPIVRDHAVVIGRLDYSESSQVVVLFARDHGKIRAIAKGIKRSTKTRFAPGIDLLDVGQVVVSSRQERSASLATLREWKETRSTLALREKIFRIQAGQYAAEITGHLTEDWDPHPSLFDHLTATLTTLLAADEPIGAVVSYQRTLLKEIGSLPRFDACAVCGRLEDLIFFSSFEGGMLCRHCESGRVEKREVSPAAVRILSDPHGVVTAEIGVFDVLDYHISHLMGREPKLSRFLISSDRRRVLQ